jgi:hypothetical protein
MPFGVLVLRARRQISSTWGVCDRPLGRDLDDKTDVQHCQRVLFILIEISNPFLHRDHITVMKLVSFDVGLRNLAFCILEGTSRKDVKILHWDLIDVMAEGAGHDNPKCFKCRKPANWKQQEQYACSVHKKAGRACTKTSLSQKTLEALKKEAGEFHIEGTTKKSLVDALYSHYAARVWKRCVKSCKQGSVVDLAPLINTSLTSRTAMWNGSTKVIFEQQPDKRMMAVQAMMHMWFECHGYSTKGVSAVHKLTNMVTVEDATKTYKGRKKTGIVHAAALVPVQ